MMFFSALGLLFSTLSLSVNAAVVSRASAPVVKTSWGSYQGASSGGVDTFLGMNYAQPPVGNLRFRQPLPPKSFSGTKDASAWGNACLQQYYTLPYIENLDYSALAVFVSTANQSEDCLNLNVFRPAGVAANAKLPVVVFFYGGAFMTGDASSYNATNLVARSVALGEPVIYVSLNYRVNAFGFLGGQEVMDAKVANLGIWDQILAMGWIQTQISKFGGDPRKVTLWGQSAGGISVTSHMILNAKNPVPYLRAAVMESSITSPMEATNSNKNNYYYNYLVQQTNCTASKSTLECLRKVPSATLLDAVNTTPAMFSPNSMNFTWFQSVDNVLFNKSLKEYIREGQYAKVPVLAGGNDDDGTVFSFYAQDIVTDDQWTAYVTAQYLAGAPAADIASVAAAYPSDPAAGSPFGTGSASALTPQFKRLAAFHGDWSFTSGRREAFGYFKSTQNVWAYLWKRRKDLLYLGSVHGGELYEIFSVIPTDFVLTDSLVNFVTNLNPNYPKGSTATSGLSTITWPTYGSSGSLLQISDNTTEAYTTTTDNYRQAGIQAVIKIQQELGL